MQPRERYTHAGPGTFGEAELLALILGTGTAGHSALEIGAGLLARYGGLAGVSRAQVAELQQQPGVGPARAVRLHAALELGRRLLCREGEGPPAIGGPADAHAHLGPPLQGLAHEELHARYVDRRRRPVGQRRLTRGNRRSRWRLRSSSTPSRWSIPARSTDPPWASGPRR